MRKIKIYEVCPEDYVAAYTKKEAIDFYRAEMDIWEEDDDGTYSYSDIKAMTIKELKDTWFEESDGNPRISWYDAVKQLKPEHVPQVFASTEW